MTNVQLWNGGEQLDRKTQRAVDIRQKKWALESLDASFQEAIVNQRLEAGSMMAGHLNHWLETLGAHNADLADVDPASAARCGHVLDQLAINGSGVISSYMRGPDGGVAAMVRSGR